eukprot:355474-Rhodomonas_salina.1
MIQNATVTSITNETVDGRVFTNLLCDTPLETAAQIVNPLIVVPRLGLRLPVPTFEYRASAASSISSITPQRAPVDDSLSLRLRLLNFPGVSRVSLFSIVFRCQGGNVPSVGVSYSPIDPTKDPQALQNFDLYVMSPTGLTIVPGFCTVVVSHRTYPQREARFSQFLLVDAAAPTVAGISTDDGKTGFDSVLVGTSTRTEVSILVENAPQAVSKVMLANQERSITLSQLLGDDVARVSFPSFGSDASGIQYGMVQFAQDCGTSCRTDCCRTAS